MRQFNLSQWAVRHPALMLFLILAISIGGGFSYLGLGRQEDPSFTIKVAVITAQWPGANAQDMQDQVADRIEKKLQELPFFNKVSTYTKPGFTAMQVEFKDFTPAREVPQLFYQMRKKISDIRGDLPAGLIGPNINDEFGDVDSVLYLVTGDGTDYLTLKQMTDAMKRVLLRVPDVTKVNVYGVQDPKIFIEFSHAKLATLGLAPQSIFDSLARQNSVNAAGTVQTQAQRVPIRVTGAIDSVEGVANIPVDGGGRSFRLGDVASVTPGFDDPPSFLIRQTGKPALAIGIVMQKGGNILALGDNLAGAMQGIRANLPAGIDVTQIADQPKVVDHAFYEFMKSFIEALVIVLAVSFVSLGWRTGIVVATSVPLVLAVVFIAMSMMGMDLHRITLGALIIALGLLVDDAIIAVEMMVVKMEQGWNRQDAAAFAWTSTAFPMLTGTLVTAIGFVPIGFANSAVGEYAGGIFWVVALALIASWFVAVIFTPYLGVLLLPAFKRGAHASVYDTRLYRSLRRLIALCVRRRGFVILATLAIFGGSIVAFKNVAQQFFPLSERPELFIEMRLPEGTSIGVTAATAAKAENLLRGDEDITTYTTYIGQSSPRFWLGLNQQLPNEAFAQVVILSKDVEARERIKARLELALVNGAMPEARVRIDRFNFGPPVGFPVQFRVIGPETAKAREIAAQVRDIMRQNPDALDPNLDWNERMPSVRLEVDQDRARALGLSVQDVSQTLQTLLSGFTITTLRFGTEKVDVIARAIAKERLDLGRIGDLTLTTRNGIAVNVAQIAKISFHSEEPIIWRRNRDMVMTVRADVPDGVQAPDVTNAIWPNLADLRTKLEPGYRLEIGGAIEESAKGNASIFKLFPIMIIGMLTVLMLQLQNFSRLFLVFSTAPLGIIGASLALNLSHRPFGFVALLGLIALAGMIMRNAVILVDQIEADVAAGTYSRREAIVEATVRRARPVLLTAFAAILAMIPLTESAFWGPMAFTIMGGLFVATFLTLLFLPALYAFWFRNHMDQRPAAQPRQPARLEPVDVVQAAE